MPSSLLAAWWKVSSLHFHCRAIIICIKKIKILFISVISLTGFYGRLCTIGAVWLHPNRNTRHSYQLTSSKAAIRNVQYVCICLFVGLSLCASLVFILSTCRPHFSFLLLFISVMVYLYARQLLVVRCWLCWEVKWGICPQAVGPPPTPSFFLFFIIFLSLVYRKQSSTVHRTLDSGPLTLPDCMQRWQSSHFVIVYILFLSYVCPQLMSELKLRVMWPRAAVQKCVQKATKTKAVFVACRPECDVWAM